MKYRFLAICSFLFLVSCSPKLAPDSNCTVGKWVLIELQEVRFR